MPQRQQKQQTRANCEAGITNSQQALAVEAICNMPRYQEEKEPGQKLRKTHVPEVERSPRDLVYLPTYGH